MKNFTDKEEEYIEAKEAYYNGNPIMSDDEFDILEAELLEKGSSVIEMVGFKIKGSKAIHPTPMKSLDKIQFQHDYIPLKEWIKWLNQANDKVVVEFTPKFDGNSVNLIYKLGKFVQAITRGDGKEGQDITNKIKYIVPDTIDTKEKELEIRGEVVIKKEIFERKYKLDKTGRIYKNPRNWVAGMLNRDQLDMDIIIDLTFMAFDVKPYKYDLNNLYDWGFISFKYITYSVEESKKEDIFIELFKNFTNYRKFSAYQLDGFVAKFDTSMRTPDMEKDHHPKWAMAIKFPPKIGTTIIEDIEWSVGTTGALIPVAVLSPVDLDGSMVKRVILYNYQWILDNGCGIGAEIQIVKSGDIIPKVLKILKQGRKIQPMSIYEGIKVVRDGVNLKLSDPSKLPQYEIRRLHAGIVISGIKNVGPALTERIYNAGFKTLSDVLVNMNEENLIKSGYFKKGRELELLMENVKKVTEISLSNLIRSFKFEGAGNHISIEVAKYLSGVDYDFSGLEKSVVALFTTENSKERLLVEQTEEFLNKNNIKIKRPMKKTNETKVNGVVEFTGSPKDHGFPLKADFEQLLNDHGYVHGILNADCSCLVTDDYNSSSSKMKKAVKLGVKILTYSDFVEKYIK